jgi:hypothetical protein
MRGWAERWDMSKADTEVAACCDGWDERKWLGRTNFYFGLGFLLKLGLRRGKLGVGRKYKNLTHTHVGQVRDWKRNDCGEGKKDFAKLYVRERDLRCEGGTMGRGATLDLLMWRN